MKSYILVLSILAATASAQESASASASTTTTSTSTGSSSSAPPATTSSSTLIPGSISQPCKTYLTALDSNPDISNCLSTLVSATSEFNPSSTASYSQATLNTTLTALCGASSKCDEVKIREQLSLFYPACKSDLVGDTANEYVRNTYDILYVLLPLRNAVCAKDPAANKFCVQEIHVDGSTSNVGKALIADNGASSGPSVSPDTLQLLDSGLYKVTDNPNPHLGVRAVQARADGNTTSLVPDTNNWRATSLIYLFISPAYTAAQLCTSCTKAVLSAYVKFEAATPYAFGLTNSPLLGDQLNLWNNLTAKCETTFTSDILNTAGYDTSQTGNMVLGGAGRLDTVVSSVVALTVGLAAFLVL